MRRFVFARDGQFGHIIGVDDLFFNMKDNNMTELPKELPLNVTGIEEFTTYTEIHTFKGNLIKANPPEYVQELKDIWQILKEMSEEEETIEFDEIEEEFLEIYDSDGTN